MTRLLLWLACLWLASAAVMWWSLAPLAKSASPQVEESFRLPSLVSFNAEQALTHLVSQPVWGRESSVASAGSTDLPWRFVGAVGVRGQRDTKPAASRGPQAFVLISIDNKEPEIRRVGDTLPGGAVIIRIESDAICVRIDGRERRLHLSSL